MKCYISNVINTLNFEINKILNFNIHEEQPMFILGVFFIQVVRFF